MNIENDFPLSQEDLMRIIKSDRIGSPWGEGESENWPIYCGIVPLSRRKVAKTEANNGRVVSTEDQLTKIQEKIRQLQNLQ